MVSLDCDATHDLAYFCFTFLRFAKNNSKLSFCQGFLFGKVCPETTCCHLNDVVVGCHTNDVMAKLVISFIEALSATTIRK